MDDKDERVETDPMSEDMVTEEDESSAQDDGTPIDYETSSAEDLERETDYRSTDDFGNGSRTTEDDVADSGIGSDVDDMVSYQSGQADYDSEYGKTSEYSDER